MQQVSNGSWYRRSGLRGVLRFHAIGLGRMVLWLLGLLLAAQLIGVVMGLFGWGDYNASGVAAEFGTAILLLLVFACILGKSGTTFPLRFGTPRTPVWIGNLVALFLSGAVFLAGSLITSVLMNYGVLALTGVSDAFSVGRGDLAGGELIALSMAEAFRELPRMLLWLLEWSCIFYLLGCCLRRHKAITLTVCILVPLVCWLLLLMPVMRQAVELVESGNQVDIMRTGMQWMQWLTRAGQFVTKNWQWIQGLAALVALPLSWLCMRSTPQP